MKKPCGSDSAANDEADDDDGENEADDDGEEEPKKKKQKRMPQTPDGDALKRGFTRKPLTEEEQERFIRMKREIDEGERPPYEGFRAIDTKKEPALTMSGNDPPGVDSLASSSMGSGEVKKEPQAKGDICTSRSSLDVHARCRPSIIPSREPLSVYTMFPPAAAGHPIHVQGPPPVTKQSQQ